MKTTLLDRAIHDIKMSKFILANASDELDYETSGYHLQQAIEKAMKFKMQIHNVDYGFHHDIAKHCAKMKDNDLEVPDWLVEHADRLSSYESKTRYGEELVVVRNELSGMQQLVGDYIAELSAVTQSASKPTSVLDTILKLRR